MKKVSKMSFEEVLCEQVIKFFDKVSENLKFHIQESADNTKEPSSEKRDEGVVEAMESYVSSNSEISKPEEKDAAENDSMLFIEVKSDDDREMLSHKEMRRLIKKKKYKAFDKTVEKIVARAVTEFMNSNKFEEFVSNAIKDEIINRIEDAKYKICTCSCDEETTDGSEEHRDETGESYHPGCMGAYV